MRERKLTRHDIGREKFVSEVSISFAWHMIICGPTVSLSLILPSSCSEMNVLSAFFDSLILLLMYHF